MLDQWEYLRAIISIHMVNALTCSPSIKYIMGGEDLPHWKNISLDTGLNVFGEDGWQLVRIESHNIGHYCYIFKRLTGTGNPVGKNTYKLRWEQLTRPAKVKRLRSAASSLSAIQNQERRLHQIADTILFRIINHVRHMLNIKGIRKSI
ncbi:MAG: hypothetical protein WCI88_12940 [Chloroflexota bacterium]